MKQPSITYPVTQSVDHLSQTRKWTDTLLDTCQEKLREEYEGQEKLSKSSSHTIQLSQEVDQQLQQSQHEINNNDAMIVNIGKFVRKENNPVSPKTLKW
jgi:ABC-type uncharacterized transport system auxiliary subunit